MSAGSWAHLYYYKARVYHPELGRFMQTDPIGYADGMNWYAYVGNDPTYEGRPRFKVPKNSHKNRKPNVIYITAHRVFGLGPYHTAIEFQVDESAKPITLSAGPKNGNLTAETNKTSDSPEKNITVGVVSPPEGVSARQYFIRLQDGAKNYCNCIDYDLFPAITDSYNSNSYISGLIQATGGAIKIDYNNYVGGGKALPSEQF